MDVAASAASYLGSSAMMVEVAPEVTASSSSLAVVATEPIVRSARPAPVIIVLPSAARPRADRSLSDLVAQELRRDAMVAAAATASTGPEKRDAAPAGSMTDDDGGDETVDVNRAVIAMHDERIARLKHQIAAFVVEGRAVAQIGFLRARLQRAEAARRVAAVRSGVDGAPGKRSDRVTASTAPSGAGRPTLYPHATSRSSAAVREGVTKAARYVPAWSAPATGAAERVVDLDRADRHLTATTHHIRRLLATARQALSAKDVADAAGGRVHSAAPVRMAGLLRWEGSENWSLADCAGSRA